MRVLSAEGVKRAAWEVEADLCDALDDAVARYKRSRMEKKSSSARQPRREASGGDSGDGLSVAAGPSCVAEDACAKTAWDA